MAIHDDYGAAIVAPFTGAWIKIKAGTADYILNKSHPSRVRGLKFLTRVRGLKSPMRMLS